MRERQSDGTAGCTCRAVTSHSRCSLLLRASACHPFLDWPLGLHGTGQRQTHAPGQQGPISSAMPPQIGPCCRDTSRCRESQEAHSKLEIAGRVSHSNSSSWENEIPVWPLHRPGTRPGGALSSRVRTLSYATPPQKMSAIF